MMTLVALLVLALGVSVAVQVMPPSLLLRLLSVPLGDVRSAVVNPVTASLNVKVTVAVSPILSDVSLIVIGEPNDGCAVSIEKLLELTKPLPALPLALVTPVMSRLMMLLASVTPEVGVNVAVHVTPPSLLLTVLSRPFSIVRSALVNPLTASLNVKVTSEVSPTVKRVSATTMLAAGLTV